MFNFIASGKHIFCVNEDLSVVLCLHKMVVDLKFSRFEDQPWGFRLSGGKDFPLPLTVVKVSKYTKSAIQSDTETVRIPK